MQFDPENYPVRDYKFVPFSSLGAMAREYEVSQLAQILQVVPPESAAHGAIIKGIIDHLNVTNRDELIAAIEAGNQPNPEAQQMAMMAQQAQLQFQQSQTAALNAQAAESQSRAQKYAVETQLAPEELQIEKINAITRNLQVGDNDDKEFERRLKVADALLRESEIEGKRQNANDTNRNEQLPRANQQGVQRPVRQIGLVGEPGQGTGGQS